MENAVKLGDLERNIVTGPNSFPKESPTFQLRLCRILRSLVSAFRSLSKREYHKTLGMIAAFCTLGLPRFHNCTACTGLISARYLVRFQEGQRYMPLLPL